ncbi:MAG: branched-chain amino acid ABC transporter permease [Bacillota bacterium]
MLRNNFTPLLALLVLVLLGFAFIKDAYILNILTCVGLNALIAIGLNLLMGYTGQISLGHAGFFGLGAYISAILCVSYHLHPLFSMSIGIICVSLLAYAVAVPTLKLKGHYLAMATLGLGMIIQIFMSGLAPLTGGPSGFTGIPSIVINQPVMSGIRPFFLIWWISVNITRMLQGLPAAATNELALTGDRTFFLIFWISIIVIQIAILNLINSKIGRTLLAIHSNEPAAEALGVDAALYKQKIFAVSAGLAAYAGGLYAFYIKFISPETFGFPFSVTLVTMVVVGGMGSIWGPVLGASFLTVLPELLRHVYVGNRKLYDYEMVIYGIILILTIMYMPKGLSEAFTKLTSILGKRWSKFWKTC